MNTQEIFSQSIGCKKEFSKEITNIEAAAARISEAMKNGNKLIVFGNGGSAADAQHIAAELVGRYKLERKAFPAIALTTDTSILTAWSNDYSFETVFERQVEALAKKDDILLGISTSGNSGNVIKALQKGKHIGTVNISLTGNSGGKIKELSDININVPSDSTPRIQECHSLAYHIICELIEKEMTKQ